MKALLDEVKSNRWWRNFARLPRNIPSPSQCSRSNTEESRILRHQLELDALSGISYSGLFVGSGVIEAGCKAVIGARLKQSGMFWTVRDANDIIALRCCRLNGQFEGLLGGKPRRLSVLTFRSRTRSATVLMPMRQNRSYPGGPNLAIASGPRQSITNSPLGSHISVSNQTQVFAWGPRACSAGLRRLHGRGRVEIPT